MAASPSPPTASQQLQQRLSPPPACAKRRAASLSDLLPLPSVAMAARTASAKTAVTNALASVSSRTTQRLAKLRSSSDNFMKSRPPRTAWKMPSSLRRIGSNGPFRWAEKDGLQHATGRFEFHGEDAGASSSYFHIVADGVSSPFGRNSLANMDHVPVSSEHLANEVVRCVQTALEDVTGHNRLPIDAAAFESAVVEGVRAARIRCFQFRKSRLATTLSVAYFERWSGKLLTFTLGDSKCVVVRRGQVVYETMDVLREFNVPCVVNLSTQVASHEYMVQSFQLQDGDVCLTFSDGIADNLYKDDLTRVMAAADRSNASLQDVCDLIVAMCKLQDRPSKPTTRGHGDASTPVFPLEGSEDFVSPKLLLLNNPMPSGEADNTALYPFATAAAVEYRARALEECRDGGVSAQHHLTASLALFERHKGKQTLDRHVIVRKASRKRHYALAQLRRMGEMQTKKPDDITLFMTRFVRQQPAQH